MAAIESSAYGKTRVRLIYVDRTCEAHELRELAADILFEGDFAAAYIEGDNSSILPTDSIKNAIYVLARQFDWDSIETLGHGIAEHFLNRIPHLRQVSVAIEQVPWQPIAGYGTAFVQSAKERRVARLKVTRSASEISAGIKDLQILKTADSGFAGFLKDDLTTLEETDDRLLGTVLEAEWEYVGSNIAFNEAHREIRAVLLECFARHKSKSLQHTLFAMGQAVLEKVQSVASIHLLMPNKHCLLVDLARFGVDNPNQVFVPTEEPVGYIEARMVRSG